MKKRPISKGHSPERELISSINEAEERRKNARVPGSPEVGIFWLFEGKLLVDGVPVNEAECSGDFVNHRSSHASLWRTYRRAGAVPHEVEYEEPPRGRVVYNAKLQQFTLFADACILKKRPIVEKIIRELHLPPDTVTESDPHYRCFHCLGRISR